METQSSMFSPPPPLHDSSLLSPLFPLFFCGEKTQLKYYVDGYDEERHTSSMTFSLPPGEVTDLAHSNQGEKMCRLPPSRCH